MKTNRSRLHRIVTTAAIFACILLPVSAIAAEPSASKHLSPAAKQGSLGLDINRKDENGKTCLMDAASGHLDAVKFLIDEGADVHAKDEKGRTPLSIASAGNRPEVVV